MTNNNKQLDNNQEKLWTKSFIALIITQFLVALNDNIFRWLIIPIGKCAIGWSDSPDQIRMIGSLAFLLPFLIFTSYAGYCCDRFNRRSVIIGCKAAELLIVLLGTFAILSQSVPFMLVILFLLATQSAFFSPAKYSSLPTVVPEKLISKANGYYSMTTMIACIGGQLLGGILFVWSTLSPEKPVEGTGGMHFWGIWSGVIIGVAIAGLISSFFIPSMKPVDPKAKFPINPFFQTFSDLRFLFRHRFVFWVAMGSSFFWGLGALAQVNIDKFATEMLFVRQDYAMLLLVALSLGLAAGALLAGYWSRGKIEMGLVPIGAFFIVLFALFLSLTPSVSLRPDQIVASPLTFPFLFAAIGLFALGTSAGMYDIPLLALLQTKSPVESRGRILAAYNFYSFAAMAIFSVFQGLLATPVKNWNYPGLNATQIWFVCALISLPVLVISLKYLFLPFLNLLVLAFLWLFYRPRIIDAQNIPETGPVLLLGNHVSYLDALLIYCNSKRPVRFIADSDFVPQNSLIRFIVRKTGVIQFIPGNRHSVIQMIREARKALQKGDIVVIFPEGGITRTGQIRAFESGFLHILKENKNVPIVPFYLGGLWGSQWAYAKPRKMEPLCQRLVQRVTVAFGKPVYLSDFAYLISLKKQAKIIETENIPLSQAKDSSIIAQKMQHIVEELGVDSMNPNRFPNDKHLLIPPRKMLRNFRKYSKQRQLVDSTGADVNGRQALLKVLVLRHFFHRLLKKDQMIGLLFPTSVGGALINAAIALDRRIPINLNYTFSNETNNYCLKVAGIKKVIATNRLLKKIPSLELDTEMLVLEDIISQLSFSDKLIGWIQSLLPIWFLERLFGLTKIKPSDLNTIIFTSGSTGRPKGVILTQANIAANVQGFYQLVIPKKEDSLLSTLPMFHSFGYTTMVWFPLMFSTVAVYHYNPLEPKMVGEMARKYKATIAASTATFLRNYCRRCPPEDFATLNLTVAGAEKLPADLAEQWKEKFGQYLVEGFGATELAPVLSANLTPCRFHDSFNKYMKIGSIGRLCPGFAARIVDLESDEELPVNFSGMLEVKGASVTPGYYNEPEKTKASFHDDWYRTGDIARIDEDGFVFITGRESRMSKIGGEMVPHIFIEERIELIISKQTPDSDQESLSDKTHSDSPKRETADIQNKEENVPEDSESRNICRLVVTAVPDERKGEKIVVLYTELPISPDNICKLLLESGMPQIWVPSPQNFKKVDQIPVLGTGKLSLNEIKNIALSLYGFDTKEQ